VTISVIRLSDGFHGRHSQARAAEVGQEPERPAPRRLRRRGTADTQARPACAVAGESAAPHGTGEAAHHAAPSPAIRSRNTPPSPALPDRRLITAMAFFEGRAPSWRPPVRGDPVHARRPTVLTAERVPRGRGCLHATPCRIGRETAEPGLAWSLRTALVGDASVGTAREGRRATTMWTRLVEAGIDAEWRLRTSSI
jgi:hypothetical protein